MIKTIGLAGNLAEKITGIVLEKTKTDPMAMANIQIILPTRRACRTVKEAFLQKSREQAILLPKIIPLYELDNLSVDIPPAMDSLERTLLLTQLCAKKQNVISADQAFKIAISLGQLLDEFYQFEADTTKLSSLVQNPIFAEHWNETVIFLNIITREWPKILKERSLIDEADRRIRLIDAYTRSLASTNKTIIAAGLDGGLPAVQRLLSAIDRLPNGIILMEGLDTDLSQDEFDALPTHHYQNSVHKILTTLNKKITDVAGAMPKTPREQLIAEAFKPETQTDTWRQGKLSEDCIQNVMCINCETASDEALTIALFLRGALEVPGKTAALVTPDRELARRVIAEMQRWGIILDDSAGTPATQTDLGIYLRLIVNMAINDGKASDLLALLKHPLTADGQNPMSFRQHIKTLEKESRRHHIHFNPELNTDISSFIKLFEQKNVLTSFKTLLTAHIQLAEALATSHDRTGAERLWHDNAGQTTFTFLTKLLNYADLINDIEPSYYPTILDMMLNTVSIRPLYGMHPRLDILGPIEARFHHYDVCIIGGLNENTFPGVPDTGPWLNRPMRQTLELLPPEHKIAELAMDFAHCFCSPEVILTRAEKIGGTETIPSRFLARLEAALAGSQISFEGESINWAKMLDKPDQIKTIGRPAPCPPVEARPNSLAVTKIETWMRNPYAIYAAYILGLFPLNPLENNQKQQLYGMAVHEALKIFIEHHPNSCDKNELMMLADQMMTEKGLTPADKSFYLPRFEQTAEFIVERQAEMENSIQDSLVEEKGSFTFNVDEKPFTLTAKVDRIDILKGDTARVLDYKTGTVPSMAEMMSGYAPQLPLETLIFLKNGFKKHAAVPVTRLEYWKLAAQKDNCNAINMSKKLSIDDLVERTYTGLENLVRMFNNPDVPYYHCPIPGKEQTYNDYEHLSRSAEWAFGDDS